MIATQNARAFGPSWSNRLMAANQNARAFGPSPTVARMKMKTKSKSLVVAMTKMMVAIRHHSIHHPFFGLLLDLLDLVLLGLPHLGCP